MTSGGLGGGDRLEDSAGSAVGGDADYGDGQGVAAPGAHPGGGLAGGGTDETGDLAVPGDERRDADEGVDGATEGERSIAAAEANRDDGSGFGSGLDPDDVPEEGPDAGHRTRSSAEERPSRSSVDPAAPSVGSGDSTETGGVGGGSDLGRPLG